MTIRIGDNPQNDPKVNKFLDHKSHEGHRGKIIAISKDGRKAIIKSLTTGFEGIVKRNRMYLIEEYNQDSYPQTVNEVKVLPKWAKIGGLEN